MFETGINIIQAVELPGNDNKIWNRLLALAVKRNIKVDLVNLHGTHTKGLLFAHARQETIIIDTRLNNKERDFVMAHELAHWVLHKKKSVHSPNHEPEKSSYDDETTENDADRFAERLLKWLARKTMQ